jgi:hypothetical protein
MCPFQSGGFVILGLTTLGEGLEEKSRCDATSWTPTGLWIESR